MTSDWANVAISAQRLPSWGLEHRWYCPVGPFLAQCGPLLLQ